MFMAFLIVPRETALSPKQPKVARALFIAMLAFFALPLLSIGGFVLLGIFLGIQEFVSSIWYSIKGQIAMRKEEESREKEMFQLVGLA
jgi:hypothetical protein